MIRLDISKKLFISRFDKHATPAPEDKGELLCSMGHTPQVLERSLLNPFGAAAIAVVDGGELILIERNNIPPQPGSVVYAVGQIGLFGVEETCVNATQTSMLS